jgi:type I restriction enzyme S subunit
MNRELLLQHFDRISEAPDAIPRLRRFILDLAVRGKLVEQDPSDEPAAELLKRIQAEKERFDVTQRRKDAKKGKNGGDSRCDVAALRESAFDLPVGWEWTLLSQISDQVHYGYTASADHTSTEVRMLRITDIQNNRVNWESVPGCQIPPDAVRSYELRNGDLLIARTGGTIGKSYLVENLSLCAVFASYLIRVKPNRHSLPSFIKLFAESQLYWQQLYAKSMGTGQPNVNGVSLSSLLLPLPPLAEQHRIVAKVHELMALCDQLEAERNQREAHRDKLLAASLNRISSTTAEEAKDAARFHLSLLPRLITKPEHIKQLRQIILNLAVRGQLTQQDKSDGDSRQGLKDAFEERTLLVKKGQLARKCLTSAAWLNAAPFSLPNQWVFASFEHLAQPVANALKAGPFGSALKKEFYVDSGYKIYGQEQVIKQNAHFGDYYISAKKFKELQSCEVKPGDLLVSLVGTIGKVLILPSDSKAGIINPRLIKISLNKTVVAAEYVQIMLQSPWVREFLFAESHGTTMDVLSLTILKSIPIPLPPLSEQHRIVAKVAQLMSLCDQLEEQLTTTAADSRLLLEAVLRDALQPSVVAA